MASEELSEIRSCVNGTHIIDTTYENGRFHLSCASNRKMRDMTVYIWVLNSLKYQLEIITAPTYSQTIYRWIRVNQISNKQMKVLSALFIFPVPFSSRFVAQYTQKYYMSCS